MVFATDQNRAADHHLLQILFFLTTARRQKEEEAKRKEKKRQYKVPCSLISFEEKTKKNESIKEEKKSFL